MLGVVNGQDAVCDCDSLARKGDDSLDDVFIWSTSDKSRVFKHDDLSSFGNVGLILHLSSRDGESVDDKSITVCERVVHAVSRYGEATKDKSIDQDRADKDDGDKCHKAESVFNSGVSCEVICFHFLHYTVYMSYLTTKNMSVKRLFFDINSV